jgi:hypothetical protein
MTTKTKIAKGKIKAIKVESSNIETIGHDGDSTLEIKYLGKNGAQGPTYRYSPVSEDQFEELKKAESKGKWVHEHIRKNERIGMKKMS